MIRALWADFPRFKRVEFKTGLNVITAERTNASLAKDTRNGLGKSSVVILIRYLLGLGSLAKTKGTPIYEWTFYLHLTLNGSEITVARSPKQPGRIIFVAGNIAKWQNQGYEFDIEDGLRSTDVKSWVSMLGQEAFGLPFFREQYAPSFGSLNSYFMRSGKDAFIDPFLHDRVQYEWDRQVNNGYLLGLDWRDGQRFQVLRDQEKAIANLGSLAELRIVKDFIGARTELESERGRLIRALGAMREQINHFQMAPQYAEIEEDADDLTTRLNTLSNANYSARQLLSDYEETLRDEASEPYLDVESIYENAGAVFKSEFLQELNDVRAFHTKLIENRRNYLTAEITRLRVSISARELEIRYLDDRRSRILQILEQNRALQQYTLIRTKMEESERRLATVDSRIGALNQIESAKTQLKIEGEILHGEMLQHYNERRESLDKVASLFNDASQHLYNAPGNLLVVPGRRGYQFSYAIERKGSDGIDSAAIFCYDISLAQHWAHQNGLNTLIHDSTLFDPIEERQVAHALELASERAEADGFQYICMLNTDRIPSAEFTKNFSIDDAVILRLHDATEDGGLFGIRFGATTKGAAIFQAVESASSDV